MNAKTLMTFLQARGVEFHVDDDGGLAIEGYLDLAKDYLEEIKAQKEAILALLTNTAPATDQYVDPIVDADPTSTRDENFWQDGWYELVTSAQQILAYKWAEVPYDRRPLAFPERDYYVREMSIAHAEHNRDAWRAAFDGWVACQDDAIERILAGETLKQWPEFAAARAKYARVVAEIANVYSATAVDQQPSPGQPLILAVERKINEAMFNQDITAVEQNIQELRRAWKSLGLPLVNVEPSNTS